MKNWGDTGGRLDPVFGSFISNLQDTFAYEIVELKSVLAHRPMYGANEEGLERKSKDEIRYIRITDIDENGILTQGLGATCQNAEEKYLLSHEDIIIARSGNTVGKSYIHNMERVKENCVFAGYLIKFRVDETVIFPYYLFYYLQLSFFESWKNATMRLAGQPNINAQEYKSLPLPLPPKEIQKKIIHIMDAAYDQKNEKEKQAVICLEDISSYLIQELGIVLPQRENEDQVFYVTSTKVQGGRLDPKKYSHRYQEIFNAVRLSPLEKCELHQLILDDASGNWGVNETETGEDLVTCLTIRATEFDSLYNLNLDNTRVKYRKYKPCDLDKMNLQKGDILIEKSGGSEDQPVGRVAFIEKEMLGQQSLAFSNFIHKIVVDDEKVMPEYLYEYLRFMHAIKATEVMQNQTSGIRNLILKEYFKQIILLPPKERQLEIVTHIKSLRVQAWNLGKMAKTVLKDAKEKAEKILSGKTND